MRIISGTLKGRRLQAPKKLPVRPTTDKVKESLLNILQHKYDFSEAAFLDLFAGTGNISYEFFSRGCTKITCVEKNKNCVRFIQKTAKILAADINIIPADVFVFLKCIKNSYDIIFADPPYAFSQEDCLKMIAPIFEKKLLKPHGVLILEHSKHTNFSEQNYFLYAKKYGSTFLSFFGV